MNSSKFLDKMGNDWAPSKRKMSFKKHKTNWFFEDYDGDGVMNGIDCRPYNKYKQDIVTDIGNMANTAINTFNQGVQTVGTTINKFIAPKQQQLPPAPQMQLPPNRIYEDTNNPQQAAALNALSKLNTQQYVSSPQQQNIVAQNMYKFTQDNNIVVSRPQTSPQDLNFGNKGMAGALWQSVDRKITIGPNWQNNRDENSVLAHETSHAMDSFDTNNYKRFDSRGMYIYDRNTLDSTGIRGPLYSDVTRENMPTEAKAYYVQNYYMGKLPRNEIVDAFESNIGARSSTIPRDPNLTARDVVDAGNAVSYFTQQVIKERNSKIYK